MLKLGISQAQTQFTQLLNRTILISRASANKSNSNISLFSQFVGILDNNYETNDIKYNEIVK